MTEPTYEINKERISQLSISDLLALIKYVTDNNYENYFSPQIFDGLLFMRDICKEELDKRINDIIIF